MFRTTLLAVALLFTGTTLADAQAKGTRVNVNGMQTYYEVSGSGEPLIVLHGAYMNIPSMGGIIPKLARTHTVYALELQGHGRTTDIDRPIRYQDLADDVAAFMDRVGLKRADVFGYSMGAIAGLQLAIRHPAKVNRLVMASGAYDVEGWQPAFKEVIPQMNVEMIPPVLEQEYRKLAANPGGFRELARKLGEQLPGTIVTTAANEFCRPIHDRMPVILEPADYELWLDPAVKDDPVYAEHWAGRRELKVSIEADRIVLERAGGESGD
jgi:pimeloyl-ACP methyl ester carboxylesterase